MVHCDTVWCRQIDKIITVSIFFTQLLTVCWFLVSPNEFRNFLNIWRYVEIYNWTLLWVHISVTKNEFFVFKLGHTGIRQLIPSLSFRADAFSIESVLILLELGQKTGSHLQIRSPGIQKLKSFQQWPTVPSHDESCNYEASSVLSPAWLDEDTLVIFNSLFHKSVDFFRDFLSCIKECLFLIVLPVES